MFTLVPVQNLKAKDGSRKILWKTEDGHALESAVLPNTKDKGHTVCLSTQIGCPLACSFCASGAAGFIRNCGIHEIVEQAVRSARDGSRVTNIVLMGMGEPFLNLPAVLDAMRILNDPDLVGVGARQLTVSTAGLPDGIRSLADFELQVRLAVSLHFFRQELRERWMPVAKAHPLDKLVESLREYQKKTGRQFTIEWALFKGINDHLQAADDLRKLLKGLDFRVNLIPWNPVATSPAGLKPADPDSAFRIMKHLRRNAIPATIRKERGGEIAAACGQLRMRDLAKN
jgi:23S rRNA (adenine2503-C2)-methyltransferase